MHLTGKVSVVTGAGRGLGQRAAIRLAAMGSAVAVVSRSRGQLEEAADLIRAANLVLSQEALDALTARASRVPRTQGAGA